MPIVSMPFNGHIGSMPNLVLHIDMLCPTLSCCILYFAYDMLCFCMGKFSSNVHNVCMNLNHHQKNLSRCKLPYCSISCTLVF